MTVQELRTHPEYTLCMGKIKGWRVGGDYTVNYAQIPTAKANA